MKRFAWALLLVSLASGAGRCEEAKKPPQNEPGKAFNTRLEPKLTKDELAYIMSEASGGVYRLSDDGGSIANFTPDSEYGPVLKFEDVATLIQAHAEKAAALARERLAEAKRTGRPPVFSEAEKRLAQDVRRNRHMFLSAEEMAVLDEAFGYRYGRIPAAAPSADFDRAPGAPGATLPPAAVRAAPGRAERASDPAPSDPEARKLYEKVVENVSFSGTPEEQAALKAMLGKVLETDSGRRFAADFLNGSNPGEALIEFEDIPKSKVIDWNGKKIFTGSGGHAHTSDTPIRIHLNRNYLAIDDGTRDGASTLAHEFLGHSRQALKARRAGVDGALHLWDQDEPNAGAVGWTAGMEMGLPATEGWMWTWIGDPAGYPAALKTNQAYYAGTFSLDEMRRRRTDGTSAVPGILETRLQNAWKELQQQDENERSWKRWERAYSFFSSQPEYKGNPERLEGIRRRIDGQLTGYIPSRRGNLEGIVSYLGGQATLDALRGGKDPDTRGGLIAHYSSAQGQKTLEATATAADSPLFRTIEAENTWMHGRLTKLTAGRDPSSEAPKPPAEWVTWEEFAQMVRKQKAKDPKFMDGP
ncbi:MAG: hypothetical protein HY928_17420 [Elusimicrobia bacterium]|nr:hypothetical protein [Elusimicrobiota bacterium]